MGIIKTAPVAWDLLNGVVCAYKPAGITTFNVRSTVIGNICRDLNQMECRPPTSHIFIEGDTTKSLRVQSNPSYADSTLVVGPRYQTKDVRCSWATHLGRNTSGVFVLGINDGIAKAKSLHFSRPTRSYHIKGLLGQATDNFFIDGKIIEKSSFAHAKKSHIDRILASMQAAHQKTMFEQSGVDIQSQTAYELAVQGPIRPISNNLPLMYGIKCHHFSPPDFTIEIQCINEYEAYLKALVHEIGVQLRSTATCTALQCIRHGQFTLEHALLRKHWTVQNFIDNVAVSEEILYQSRHNSALLSSSKERSSLKT